MLYFSLRTSKSKNFTCVILALGALLTLTACPPSTGPIKNIVKQFNLNTYLFNNDNWIEMKATLNTGGFKLANMSLPIMDPFQPGKNYGIVVVNPTSSESPQGGDLTITIDISKISKIPANTHPTLLPNGKALPIGKLNQSKVISLPIQSTGGQIYFSFGSGVAILGVALPFPALDRAGQLFSGIDLFQPFIVGPANLSAGIFTGSAPKTSGFGLFANLSPMIAKTIFPEEVGITETEEENSIVFESTVSSDQFNPEETQGILNLLHEMSFEDIVLEIVDIQTEDPQTEGSQAEDSQAEDSETEDSETEDPQVEGSQTEDLQAESSKTEKLN